MTGSGWLGYGGGGENSALTPEQRSEIERQMRERRRQRGALLARVEVEIYENGADAQVSFPPESVLDPGADGAAIADVVARAKAELERWR